MARTAAAGPHGTVRGRGGVQTTRGEGRAVLEPAPSPRSRRRGPAALAVSSVLLGPVVAAAAAGLAVPRLEAGVEIGVAIAAVAVLLVAVAVAAGGVVALVRPLRGGRRTLGAAAGLVVSALVLYLGAVPVTAATAPGPRPDGGRPTDVGLTYEDVSIATSGGAALAGWWVPSSNGAAVVLLHGSGATRSSVLPHAEVLARHGYGVLLVDARGHGASTGRAMLWGWFGEEDVPRVAAFAASRPGVDDDRVGVVGLSMGGEEALGAAARSTTIRAVVAEGTTGRTGQDLAWLRDAYGWRGTLTQGAHQAQTVVADLLTTAHRPPTLAAAVSDLPRGSVLLVAAGASPDEQYAAAALRAAAPGTVEVWVAQGAGHTGALRTDPRRWEQRVVAFLDRSLAPAAAAARPTGGG